MKPNVGNADMIARIVIALVLFSLAWFLEGNARWFAALGFIPLLAASLRFCPLYTMFGISTCQAKRVGG